MEVPGYDLDYLDSKQLWKFAMENIRLAEQYYEARKLYAVALKYLKIRLAKEYADHKIELKHSEDKAYLILADRDEKCKHYLMLLIEKRNEYKGLEKVISAREAALSFNQSLIKLTVKQ